MRISKVVEFLDGIREADGDLEVESITGFWVRTRPSTGERYIAPAVGDGLSLDEVLVMGLEKAPRRG